jgi:hypothetical protein
LSLHHGFTWARRVWGLDFLDAKGAQHHGGTIGPGCDGALGGVVTEVDIDERARI